MFLVVSTLQSAVPTTPGEASVQHAAEDKMVQNGTQCTVKKDDALHQQYSLKGKIVVQNHTVSVKWYSGKCRTVRNDCGALPQQYSLKAAQRAALLLLFSCCCYPEADDDFSGEDD